MRDNDVILSKAQRSRRTRTNSVRANRCNATTSIFWTLALPLLGIALLSTSLQAQNQQQDQQNQSFTLKVNSDIVLTNVVPIDKKTGQVVKGLTQKDFTITENGKPQQITSFDFESVDEAAALI